MANAEHAAFHLAEPRAERHVKTLVDDFPHRVRVDSLGHHHARQDRAIHRRIGTLDLQTPGAHCTAARFGQTFMARKHVLEPFAKNHVECFREPVQQVRVRRVGPVTRLVHLDDFGPVPEAARQLRLLAGGNGFGRYRVEADARRQHQAFLRARHRDVHAPVVVAIVGASKTRDRIDQQQRRMTGSIDRAAYGCDIGRDARRGFVVDDTNGLDRVLRVLTQTRFDHLRLHAAPPALNARQTEKLRLQPEAFRHFFPQRSEVTGFEHQHVIARAQRVRQRRFPCTGAGRRVDHHRLLCLEDLLDAVENLQPKRPELRTAMVDGRIAHRAQDAIRHRARPRDLQEVAAGGMKI